MSLLDPTLKQNGLWSGVGVDSYVTVSCANIWVGWVGGGLEEVVVSI